MVLLFAVGGFVAAQTELANFLATFVEEGRATWGTTIDGLQAAHPSLPLGSTPTIRNPATGREVTVTVTKRIPVSTARVIDISTDAAQAIGLEPGGSVLVRFPSLAATSAPALEPQSSPHAINITIHNHVIPLSAWQQRHLAEPISPEPSPPAVRVTPGLPDPASGGIYRLRVGTWSDTDDALIAFRQLRAAGFNTIREYSQDRYRVYASGVPASEVSSVVQQLGGMGFRDIYIGE